MPTLKQTEGRTAKTKVWKVSVIDNRVNVTWGQDGGKMQTTVQTHKGVNIGQTNEKSPRQVAQEWADRQVLLKKREGYKEVDAYGELIEEESAISIESFIELPSNLRFYKPQNSLPKYLEKLIEQRKAWFVRKRNGEMVVAVKGEDNAWRFYSSKLLPAHHLEVEGGIPWADRFPQIIHELDLLDAPPQTILLGELVASQSEDDLYRVGSVMKSLTPQALHLQIKEPPLCCCFWDVAFWGGEDLVSTTSFKNRHDCLHFMLYSTERQLKYLCLPEVTNSFVFPSGINVKEAVLSYAKEEHWEGYVVIDPDQPGYGDKALSWGGKADRPKYCGKLKPKLECDFIARWDATHGIGTWGKGKKSGGVGALFLYLWDPEKKEEVFISKCGGGLTDRNVMELADPWLYPIVVEVEFSAWTPKGSLQFPEFASSESPENPAGGIRIREDKTVKECLISQRPDLEDLT